MPNPLQNRRARGDEGSARLRDRFVARYSGSWAPDDAFDWSRHPDADSRAGTPSPRRALRDLRERLYRPGTSDEDVRRYEARAVEVERELAAVRAALQEARGGLPSARSPGRRGRTVVLAAVSTVAVVVGAVLISTAERVPRTVTRTAVPVHRAEAIPLRLRGTAAQIAALRAAIHGDSEGPGALVTATAIRGVPALRTARALSESDLTATGRGTITVPDLDEFSPQRNATVLVFCDRAASYDWTATGYRAGVRPQPFSSASGHGRDCSGLTYITVPLPAGVHRFTLRARVSGPVRFLLMLQSSS